MAARLHPEHPSAMAASARSTASCTAPARQGAGATPTSVGEGHITMEQRRVLLETPSGFALFSVSEDVLGKPDEVWMHFRDSSAANCSTNILGYAKIEDKSSAWEGKTVSSKKLMSLIKKWCKDGNQDVKELFVENMDLELNIKEKLAINCCSSYTVIGELIWGIKNVLHDLVPEEKDNITKEYCLPLSKGLQKCFNEYCINLPPLLINKDFISKVGFLAYLDVSMDLVSQKLREYDAFIGKIGETIQNDLSYAKVLADLLVPELSAKYDLSKIFSQEFILQIEEARKCATSYREEKLTMKDRKEIMGGLSHLLTVPGYIDKLITYVKLMESKLLQKMELELEVSAEESKSSTEAEAVGKATGQSGLVLRELQPFGELATEATESEEDGKEEINGSYVNGKKIIKKIRMEGT